MRVIEINSIDGLPGLRLVWRSLLNEMTDASFTRSCEWLETICRHQSATHRPRVLLVTGCGETIGILPLVETMHVTPWGSLRVIGYPRDCWSPSQGPIGPQPAATLMAGLRHLASASADWDVLELSDVHHDAPDYQRTRTALEVAGMQFQETEQASATVVDLPAHWPECLALFPAAQREAIESATAHNNLRQQMTFQRYRPGGAMVDDANPRWELFERCLEIAGRGPSMNTARREFLRDIHAAACRAGAADLNVLRRHNEIVACCYNLHFNGALLTIFSGLSRECPDLALNDSLNDALIPQMLRDSIEKHDHKWLPGPDPSVAAWPGKPFRRARLLHYRGRGVRALMGRLAGRLDLSRALV